MPIAEFTLDWRERLSGCGYQHATTIDPFHGACLLESFGEPEAAEAAYREQLRLEPDDEVTLLALATFLDERARPEEANEARRRAYAARARRQGVKGDGLEDAIAYFAAMEGHRAAPARMPTGMLEAIFDRYAPTFDDKLVGALSYRGPELVVGAALAAIGDGRELSVLDLGCGTGLSAPLLRSRAKRLVGVDLSAGMLDKARARGLYDELMQGEMTAVLGGMEEHFDLIVAVDVLEYFGELRDVLAAAGRRLRREGVLAFSVEKDEEPGCRLRQTGRFTHHAEHVRAAVEAAGLKSVSTEEVILRTERGAPVTGLVVVAG